MSNISCVSQSHFHIDAKVNTHYNSLIIYYIASSQFEFIIVSTTGVNIMNSGCSSGDDSNFSRSIALALMQQELPQYIQNMFVAAGYKTLQTIAEMNADCGSKPNDVDGMLDYIKQHFPNDARLMLILS